MRRGLTVALNLLIVLGLIWVLGPRDLPGMQVTVLSWPKAWDGFGGWSGLEVSANGSNFWVVSDSGTIARGQMQRDEGELQGVTAKYADWIDVAATKENPRKRERDAESLARSPSGRVCIGFERNHRLICRQRQLTGPYQTVDLDDLTASFVFNGGLEALAVGDDNSLWAIPEGSVFRPGPAPLFRWNNGAWSLAAELPRKGLWLPTGADIGPDGKLYLLEHTLLGIVFASRVRRFDLDNPGAGEIVFQSRFGRFNNLEGLAVWQDTDGLIRLTMISDDNGMALTPTQFVEATLTAGLASAD
ncbi:MAG: esterase-like activity of phytase family protein [Pseudomonadota bacterium]